ncbi:MAG: hypothetical protein MJA83_05865 [Gammaproteobacteria bacterium]|nr:hypothetical protein [Gammaproteobacteria bacterium]
MAAKKRASPRKKTVTDKQRRANQKNGIKGGRPRFTLTAKEWKAFDMLCCAAAREVDIAEAFGVSRNTIDLMLKREKGMGFKAYRNKKVGLGRARLAAKQYDMAMAGNVTMAIFLGKQWLGQADKSNVDQNINTPGKVTIMLPDNGRL